MGMLGEVSFVVSEKRPVLVSDVDGKILGECPHIELLFQRLPVGVVAQGEALGESKKQEMIGPHDFPESYKSFESLRMGAGSFS